MRSLLTAASLPCQTEAQDCTWGLRTVGRWQACGSPAARVAPAPLATEPAHSSTLPAAAGDQNTLPPIICQVSAWREVQAALLFR